MPRFCVFLTSLQRNATIEPHLYRNGFISKYFQLIIHKKSRAVLVKAMKDFRRRRDTLPLILNLGTKLTWLASRIGRLTPVERTPINRRLGMIQSLTIVSRTDKLLTPAGNRAKYSPTRSLLTSSSRLPISYKLYLCT